MTTRQRSQATPPAKEKTLAELQALVPDGPAHVTPLGYGGPFQVQTARVVLATCRDRNVAEYLARLWSTIAPVVDLTIGGVHIIRRTDETVEVAENVAITNKGIVKRRKAGKSVQVMP